MRLIFVAEFNPDRLTSQQARQALASGHFAEFAESELEARVSSWGAPAKGVVLVPAG